MLWVTLGWEFGVNAMGSDHLIFAYFGFIIIILKHCWFCIVQLTQVILGGLVSFLFKKALYLQKVSRYALFLVGSSSYNSKVYSLILMITLHRIDSLISFFELSLKSFVDVDELNLYVCSCWQNEHIFGLHLDL